MKIKRKLLSYPIVIFFGMAIILPTSFSYESNAVEKKQQSSVSCEKITYDSRLLVKPDYLSAASLKSNNKIDEAIVPIKSKVKTDKEANLKYTKEDLMLLAGLIENEAGSDFCTDEHQLSVGSVVINRVNYAEYYPSTIKEVIYQSNPKQYSIDKERFNNPSDRSVKNAKYILENGSTLPDNCIFQSEYKQGDGVYLIFKTPISTTYICYKD